MPASVPVVLCAKGIERDTGRLLSSVAEEILPDKPDRRTFRARASPPMLRAGLPTAVVVAAHDGDLARGLGRAALGAAIPLLLDPTIWSASKSAAR